MIVLGLGSNVGERQQYLEQAINFLRNAQINITDLSPIYETPALLKEGAPAEWNIPFLNMAVKGETSLSPQELLKLVKSIEKQIGRQDRGVWGPREIDIDILVYDNLCIDEEALKIPHIGLCERAFALLPLADIAPDWVYPLDGPYKGKRAAEVAAKFKAIS